MKKGGVLFSLFILLGLLAGPAMALTVQSVTLEYSHDMGWRNYTKLYQLENGSIVPALYRGDEPSLPSWLNATLFCPLDELDTATNTTTCYLDGTATSATVVDTNTSDTNIPATASGVIKNGFASWDGNSTSWGNYIDTGVNLVGYNNISLSIAIFFKWLGGDAPGAFYEPVLSQGYGANGFRLIGSDGFIDFTVAGHRLPGTYLEQGVWYFLVGTYDYNTGVQRFVIYNLNTGEKVFDSTQNIGQVDIAASYADKTWIISYPNNGGPHGVFDEARVYYNHVLTDEEIQLLLRINRYKFATLSAPAASYNVTAFLVNVTAQLPGDGGSYLLPAPVNATSSYSSVGSIGNFTFLDVGNASTASFIIPAEPGKAVPGLRELAIKTDEGIYAYGTGSLQLTTPLTAPLAKPSLITNTIQDGKVAAINWSGIDTFSKLQPSSYISSVSGNANLTILQDSDRLMILNLDAPLKLYFQNLLPIMTYDVSNGRDKIGSFKTDTLGTASYTAPAGTIYIGTPENIQQVMGNNLIELLTKILIIALMAGVFVEMTKTKMDDEMVAAIIALLVVLVIIAIIHYL